MCCPEFKACCNLLATSVLIKYKGTKYTILEFISTYIEIIKSEKLFIPTFLNLCKYGRKDAILYMLENGVTHLEDTLPGNVEYVKSKYKDGDINDTEFDDINNLTRKTPLMLCIEYALSSNDYSSVECLIEHIKKHNYTISLDLAYSIIQYRSEIILYIMRIMKNINDSYEYRTDNEGYSVLHLAILFKRYDIIKALIVDDNKLLNLSTYDDITPLMLAIEKQHDFCVVRYLIKYSDIKVNYNILIYYIEESTYSKEIKSKFLELISTYSKKRSIESLESI
jgi:hypothetical protein